MTGERCGYCQMPISDQWHHINGKYFHAHTCYHFYITNIKREEERLERLAKELDGENFGGI